MAGNETASAKDWVKKYADYLYRYAFSRVNNEETAAELVQETFLAGLENLASFQYKSSEQTWLTAILRNKISDEYKRLSRIKTVQPGNDGDDFFEENGFWKEAYQPQSFGLEADAGVQNSELDSVLAKCFKKLPGLWSSVVALKFIEEEKAEAICNKLQITAANFWVIIHRAKLNLRDCLQKNWM